MQPKDTIAQFDRYLAQRNLRLEAVVIGGAALGLLDIVTRQTRDCDILPPELPEEILDASKEFAADMRSRQVPLRDDWLNNGPTDVAALLPRGWQARLQPAFGGDAVILQTLGRSDLLKTKLFAYCDRGTDLADCLAFKPTAAELKKALAWLQKQDAHPDWPRHVEDSLRYLAERLGHEL